MAIIDPKIIKRLLVARLQSASSAAAGTLLLDGEQVPEGLTQWFRLERLTLEPVTTPKAEGDADWRAMEAVIRVHVSDEAQRGSGDNLVNAACAEILRYVQNYSSLASDHEVHLASASVEDLPAVDELRQVCEAEITVRGEAVRQTGVSMESQVYTAP